MAKIIQFKTQRQTNMEEFMKSLLQEIQDYNIDNILIACKDNDGQTVVGSCNLDVGTKMELIGYLQVNVMNNIIQQNYVTPE